MTVENYIIIGAGGFLFVFWARFIVNVLRRVENLEDSLHIAPQRKEDRDQVRQHS